MHVVSFDVAMIQPNLSAYISAQLAPTQVFSNRLSLTVGEVRLHDHRSTAHWAHRLRDTLFGLHNRRRHPTIAMFTKECRLRLRCRGLTCISGVSRSRHSSNLWAVESCFLKINSGLDVAFVPGIIRGRRRRQENELLRGRWYGGRTLLL